MAGEFQDLPLYFDYTPANTLENIRAQVMLQKRKSNATSAIVDYLQVMKMEKQGWENANQTVGYNIQGFKQMAQDANIPVLVLSQMNRNSMNSNDKGSYPNLHDLRDSGVIEQVADCVYFVYIPERYGITRMKSPGRA